MGGPPNATWEEEGPTRYSAAFVGLSGRSKGEAVIYLTGQQWCGSGGCTALVLAPPGNLV